MCVGVKAEVGDAHHSVNEAGEEVVDLVIGDRVASDTVVSLDDELQAIPVEGEWQMVHKHVRPYGVSGD